MSNEKQLPELTFDYYIEVAYDLITEVVGSEEFSEEEFKSALIEESVAGMCAGFLIGVGFTFESIQAFSEDHNQYIKNKFGRQSVTGMFKNKRG